VPQDELLQKILGRVLRWDAVQKLQRLRPLGGTEGVLRSTGFAWPPPALCLLGYLDRPDHLGPVIPVSSMSTGRANNSVSPVTSEITLGRRVSTLTIFPAEFPGCVIPSMDRNQNLPHRRSL
jgi:hypothetical protein